MPKRKPLTNEEGEVRKLFASDFAHFRPAPEALPESLAAKLGVHNASLRRAPAKQRISVQLSREVVEPFQATGAGWQTRLETALREWLESHPRT
jgi:uncharacterized protein (DUF4415 family)